MDVKICPNCSAIMTELNEFVFLCCKCRNEDGTGNGFLVVPIDPNDERYDEDRR